MSKKAVTDLEKMNKERRKAEKEYLDSQQRLFQIHRIQREGINCVEDLIAYVNAAIEDAKHFEDLARLNNNSIMYSEAIGIKREFEKLLVLISRDGRAKKLIKDGTEEKHREENDGDEAYV